MKPFRDQVFQECAQAGFSVAAIAIRHGIKPNFVRRWISLYRDKQAVALPNFIHTEFMPVEPNKRVGRRRS
ncbi:transposase [Pseudomonas marginalis]|uniref:Transposase n=1 Tax=Pseudomonas marginalis TaxID=298 RepID=A0A9X9BLU4_PSEMA|nr:transposase [Pseudomonas marginalis]